MQPRLGCPQLRTRWISRPGCDRAAGCQPAARVDRGTRPRQRARCTGLPSPLGPLVRSPINEHHVDPWQLTPSDNQVRFGNVLWSWGVHESLNPAIFLASPGHPFHCSLARSGMCRAQLRHPYVSIFQWGFLNRFILFKCRPESTMTRSLPTGFITLI